MKSIKNMANRKWGKYRLALDGYVYDIRGSLMLFLGEKAHEEYGRSSAKKFDQIVEEELEKRKNGR